MLVPSRQVQCGGVRMWHRRRRVFSSMLGGGTAYERTGSQPGGAQGI